MAIPGDKGITRTISEDEYAAHDGTAFRTGYINESHTDAAYWYILLRTGSEETAHCRMNVSAGGTCISKIWEGGTCSADGTDRNVTNLNRSSANTMSIASSYAPTITDTGTALCGTLIPGSSGRFSIGGGQGGEFEWVLKQSETYLISMRNISGDTVQSQIIIDLKKE